MTRLAPAPFPASGPAFAGIRAAARAVIVCILLLQGAALRGIDAPALHETSAARAAVARTIPAPHPLPCTGGVAPSCTISGVALGLPAHDGGRVAPPEARVPPAVASFAAVKPQWRGVPPDRPPRV